MPKRAAIVEAIDALNVLYSEKEEALCKVDAYDDASPGSAEYDAFLAEGSHVGAKRLCQSMVRPHARVRTHPRFPHLLSVNAPGSGDGVASPPPNH